MLFLLDNYNNQGWSLLRENDYSPFKLGGIQGKKVGDYYSYWYY